MSESVSYYIKLLRSMADYEKQLSAYHAKNLFELAAGYSRRSDALLAGAEALERLQSINEFREENT